MKVELRKRYPMPGPVDATWALLQNVEGVAGCMPGARIIEKLDDKTYKGTVSVRVGPATLAFKGDILVGALDAVSRSLQMTAKGADNAGTSAAAMDLTAQVEAVEGRPDASVLVGTAVVSMSGKAASFGGRVLDTVADQVLKQFAANFAGQVEALAATCCLAAATQAADEPAIAVSIAVAPPPPAPANEINGLALGWAVIKAWFGGFFRRA
jgi:carbon monoxide dehydrogenase subunit G